MRTSEKVDKIVPALLKVKAKIEAVTKGANNPFFKSKYADLNTYLNEVEPLLAEQKLVLLQPTTFDVVTGKNVVETVIYSEDGQFVASGMGIDGNLDAQKMGAAVTYFRRYTLGALLGMQAEDDDGNTASGKGQQQPLKSQATAGKVTTVKVGEPNVTAGGGTTETKQPVAVQSTAPAAKPSFRNPRKEAAKKTETGYSGAGSTNVHEDDI